MQPQYSSRHRRIRPKVHNEIRRYRLRLGLTQRELAKRLGVRLVARPLNILAEGLYPEWYLVQKEKEVSVEPA